MNKIKLFCIPYAGGSTTVYRMWKKYLCNDIELCPVELSGRGKRIQEAFCDCVESTAEEVFEIIKKEACRSEYMLFGHSMGAMIVYELCQRLQKAGFKNPLHVFVSGMVAPNLFEKYNPIISNLNDEQFKTEILEMSGTPKELFEIKELKELFVPLLRADLKIVEDYKAKGNFVNKLDSDITALYGVFETKPALAYQGWGKFTNKQFNIYGFDGGHFFINEYGKEVVNIINSSFFAITNKTEDACL